MDITNEELMKMSLIYKMFSSPVRLNIINTLKEGEKTVTELMEQGITQSALSHHLKDLKLARIVKSRKSGLNVYYSIDDNHIYEIFEDCLNHIRMEDCNE